MWQTYPAPRDGEAHLRARLGDTLEVHHTSTDDTGMPHNVDFHAVTGPGGGATVTTVVEGEEKIAWFNLPLLPCDRRDL